MEVRLSQVRHEKCISIRELSRRSGVSPKTIGRIEKNSKSPRVDTLCMLAATLGVTLDDLVQTQ